MQIVIGLSYDGLFYHGFAKQKNVRTIEEEILNVLKEMGCLTKIYFASRTDAGVHAVSQLLNLRIPDNADILCFVHSMNSLLDPCIRIHSVARVGHNFVLKKSIKKKTYLYIAPDLGENLTKLERAIDYLNVKPHDFSALSKRRKSGLEEVLRRVRVKLLINGRFQYFFFESKGFLWEQVRRTVTAIKAYGLGRISFGDFKNLLMGIRLKKGIAPAPAEGLILWDMKTSISRWTSIIDLRVIREIIKSKTEFYAIMSHRRWVFP